MFLIFILFVLFIILIVRIGKKTNEEFNGYYFSGDYAEDDFEEELFDREMMYQDLIDGNEETCYLYSSPYEMDPGDMVYFDKDGEILEDL